MITVFVDDNENARLMMERLLNNIDPDGTHYFADSAQAGLKLLEENDKIDVIFLDIEMPGINGIEAAHFIEAHYPGTNIIFVTGHPEYARDALRVYCSGFVEKPFDEDDLKDVLKHLRYPLKQKNQLVVRCEGHFAVFLNGEQLTFKRKLTNELFAYLVYKNGAMSTNGDLLGILWDGDPNKSDFLRQLVKDMRDVFESVGITDIIVKRHGSIGLNTSAYQLEGEASALNDEFLWI